MTKLPLTEEQLKAIDKLEILAAEKLNEISATRPYEGSFHDPEWHMLGAVPNWVRHVRETHANPYGASAVEGCLQNLRKVAKHFKFKLKE